MSSSIKIKELPTAEVAKLLESEYPEFRADFVSFKQFAALLADFVFFEGDEKTREEVVRIVEELWPKEKEKNPTITINFKQNSLKDEGFIYFVLSINIKYPSCFLHRQKIIRIKHVTRQEYLFAVETATFACFRLMLSEGEHNLSSASKGKIIINSSCSAFEDMCYGYSLYYFSQGKFEGGGCEYWTNLSSSAHLLSSGNILVYEANELSIVEVGDGEFKIDQHPETGFSGLVYSKIISGPGVWWDQIYVDERDYVWLLGGGENPKILVLQPDLEIFSSLSLENFFDADTLTDFELDYWERYCSPGTEDLVKAQSFILRMKANIRGERKIFFFSLGY